MLRTHRTLSLALLGGLVAGLLTGCGSTPAKHTDDNVVLGPGGNPVYEWWNNPTDLGVTAAIGSAPMVGNESMARNTAAADGRAQLAASLKAEIQSLTELWAQEAGDLANPESLSSMMNNEQFIRQVVETTLKGAVPQRYKKVDGQMYALVVLEEPEQFMNNIEEQVDESIKQDAYFETEIKKDQARERLDELINNKKEDYKAERESYMDKLENQ